MRAAVALSLLLLGCGVESPFPPADLAPLDGNPGWAVVTSDYESTAVALLEPDGELLTEAWIDSGTEEPDIVAALSGDVVLPTEPVPGELVLLDRFGVDVVTRVALPSGEVIAQLPTQLPRDDSPSGYRANPYDAVFLNDGRVLVSRFEPNPNRAAPPLDLGNDLLVVDAATGELRDRIDLSSANVPRDDGDDPVHWARPGDMTKVGPVVVVGLHRMSSAWASAEGAVAIVDPRPSPPTVEVLRLEGAAECGMVRVVPGDGRRAVVLCEGDSFSSLDPLMFAGTEHRRVRAAVFGLHLEEGGHARVEHVWRAADHPTSPVPSGSLVALGDTRLGFAAMGDSSEGTPDRFLLMDLATGETRLVLESEPFAVGTGAYDTDRGTLMLPDASRGVRRVVLEGGLTTRELAPVDPSPQRGLPPREIAPLLSP